MKEQKSEKMEYYKQEKEKIKLMKDSVLLKEYANIKYHLLYGNYNKEDLNYLDYIANEIKTRDSKIIKKAEKIDKEVKEYEKTMSDDDSYNENGDTSNDDAYTEYGDIGNNDDE